MCEFSAGGYAPGTDPYFRANNFLRSLDFQLVSMDLRTQKVEKRGNQLLVVVLLLMKKKNNKEINENLQGTKYHSKLKDQIKH